MGDGAQKLRNGTFIIPATGERSHRTFTLRRGNGADGSDDANHDLEDSDVLPSRQSLSDRWSALVDRTKSGAAGFATWLNSPVGHGILKCTLAYTLASLATFLSPVSHFLGKPDGKHVVATITVYFHPARTAGSMIEAILIAVVAVAYAEAVSLLSMATSVLVGSTWHQVAVAHALVLVVFITGGFGFIGWVKQKKNNPLVNVGSTLASLAIIGVVTKENAVLTNVFSNQKIVQLLKVLVMGITITTVVNLLVWRVSAVALLRESMSKASVSLGDMLSMISRGFLSGSEHEMLSPEFSAASASYASVYGQMTKNLREAKFERYFLGREMIYQLDRAVVKSMETLAQSIGGLRSAAKTQFALLKEAPDPDVPSGEASPTAATHGSTLNRRLSGTLRSGHGRLLALSAIDEASDESSTEEERGTARPDGAPEAPAFNCPSDIFELFIALLGPSMKSLAYTLSEILREPAFGSAPDYRVTVNVHFRDSLTSALGLFNEARANALQELYASLELGRSRTEKIQADFEEVAAACGHFSFSLQTFGEEMQKYLDVLDDLKHANEQKRRTWRWLLWWQHGGGRRGAPPPSRLPYEPEEAQSLIKPIKKTAIPQGIPDTMIQRRDTFSWDATPCVNTVVASVSQRILLMARKLARDDIRFGIKVGLGAALWAMFAFIPETRGTYQHWRGEWGLLSFMIVCSMTVGAANTTGWSRFVGTLIGVAASVVNWNITRGNAVGLVCLGYLVAFWAFWMIIARSQAPLGRITLLAYNVSTLYAYSLSQRPDDHDDDDEGGVSPLILEIVKHRAIAVTAGILWGLVVCRLVWPISARRRFKEGLSMLYLQMGLIWKRGPLAILLRSHCSRSYLRTGEQRALQKYAARLEALRHSARSEFELRGPFPYEPAGRLMACTRRVLDAFYAMSLVTQRKGRLTEGERALLRFTAAERAMLCDRICHVFQVLASSLMLEYPLTDAIPSVTGVRDRLLGKIFLFRKEHQRQNRRRGDGEDGGASRRMAAASAAAGGQYEGLLDVTVEEKDYALLYAYALVTGQVAEQLKLVEREIEGLFGVLDEDAILLQ